MTPSKSRRPTDLLRLKIIFPKSLIWRRTHLTFFPSQRNIDVYKSQRVSNCSRGVKREKTNVMELLQDVKNYFQTALCDVPWRITPMEHPSKGNTSSTVNTRER
ncbi:hypothetical protein CEXT_60251 [Caerostris extrusa]|uniref:Uncharacterized protein n=1 Tax=Caerostris extrusa TaxID=172846 RepID=A0AAV4PIU1_CAEEX|nr:hypothetical protein CEXT_60251 [Caerostris extrusa]